MQGDGIDEGALLRSALIYPILLRRTGPFLVT
jgi:hypothetical protein